MHDQLSAGRRVRLFYILHDFNRKGLVARGCDVVCVKTLDLVAGALDTPLLAGPLGDYAGKLFLDAITLGC